MASSTSPKRVRRFLFRLSLAIAVLAGLSIGFLLAEKDQLHPNAAELKLDALKENTLNDIDDQLSVIELEIDGIKAHRPMPEGVDRQRLIELGNAKHDLLKARRTILENSTSVQIIRKEVDQIKDDLMTG